MLFETPLPLLPWFLKLDFSEIPALLGAFALGPMVGVYISLIKNLLHLPYSQTAGIGEAANFLVGIAFIIPAGSLYKSNKTKQGAILGLATGILCMTLTATALNYWVLIPLYLAVLHIPQDVIVAMGQAANSRIVDLPTFVAFGVAPFNLIKGGILSAVTLLIYKRVSPILH